MRQSVGAQDYVIKSMCEKSVKHVYCTFSIMLLTSVNLSGRVPRTLPARRVWNYQCGAWRGRMCEYPTTVGFNRQLTFFNGPFSIRHQRSRHQASTCSCRARSHVSVSAQARADIAGLAVCVCFAAAHNIPAAVFDVKMSCIIVLFISQRLRFKGPDWPVMFPADVWQRSSGVDTERRQLRPHLRSIHSIVVI